MLQDHALHVLDTVLISGLAAAAVVGAAFLAVEGIWRYRHRRRGSLRANLAALLADVKADR